MIEQDSKPIMVSIRCTVYNHEPYLRQCLDGFVMQKTNFPFEAIVHDDASTDRSADIIREYAEKYPDIIKPIYETENQWSKKDGSLRRIMDEACTGKYIAFCEGDDYWTNPGKLQIQVDFMEENPDYGLVHMNYGIDNSGAANIKKIHRKWPSGEVLELILQGQYNIATFTMLYRRSVFSRLPFYYLKEKFRMGDLPLWIEIAHESKIKYIDEICGNYRVLDNSASHSSDIQKDIRFHDSARRCKQFYCDKYNVGLHRYADTFFFQTIVKLAYDKQNKEVSKKYLKNMKEQSIQIDARTYLFYYATQCPVLRTIVNLLYKLL